ncbi:OSCP, subunit 5 of the stator stalk of mitochondrial F1F0 ATP synthase [Suillus ampliporus]|nr:OSCP, subunit 5 of the stator stalk of mitochondrial F1F0 ATP synthase [Suillus ampliporus]
MLCSLLRPATVPLALGRRAASSIAHKYSNAVYSAALVNSPQTLTTVHLELNTISNVINEAPDLKAFVNNPTLSAKDRSSSLAAVYARAERSSLMKGPVSDITKNLFAVLSENGRLGETQGVIQSFNELVSKYKGELEVVVTSAAPLLKDVSSRLETILKQSQAAQQAKSLKITNKVNPSVLGGIVVDFGDKSIDLSVSSRVNKLNNILQQSV